MDPRELEKRKVLASALKDFAAGRSPETADILVAQGEKIGVTRKQLSNLYNQYKKEGVTSTPLSAPPEEYGPPASLAGAPASAPATPNTPYFATQETTPPVAAQSSGQEPKGLDRLEAMQGTPMGSTSTLGQRRSLESESGRALRMARRLERQGFGKAAEQVALAGAQAGLAEPAFRTQQYREQKTAMGEASKAAEQEDIGFKKQLLQFNRDFLSRAKKELNSGGAFNPAMATYLGKISK